jgi:hypothetical protein
MKRIRRGKESLEGIPLTKFNISSLVISIPANILDIKKCIVKKKMYF